MDPLPLNVKQIIVIRKDLKMRRGKEIAQGSHASSMWLIKRLEFTEVLDLPVKHKMKYYGICLSPEEYRWVEGFYTKVCLQVNSEAELDEIFVKASAAGLNVQMVVDAGFTEFEGPTKTCLAIGPDNGEKIDAITRDLKLY